MRDPKLSRGGRAGVRIDWPRFDHLFPLLSNVQIAHLAGCSDVAALKRRQRLGLPPWNPQAAASAAAKMASRK